MTDIRRALTGAPKHPTLTFERTYPTTAEDLRDACTDTSRLARWFGTVHGSPTAVGDSFRVALSDDPNDVATCRVLTCTNDTIAIAWAWQGEADSVLQARIVPVDDDHASLVLTHSLRQGDALVSAYGGGWEDMLHALSQTLGGPALSEADAAAAHHQSTATWDAMTGSVMHLEHTVAAPLEDVWQAFTTRDGLQSWWWKHWDDVAIEADARPGGSYRFCVPSAGITLTGTYLAVEAPHHLAFTWVWDDQGRPVPDEAVDIRLEATGEGTHITVQHSGPWTNAGPASNYREGWTFTLGQLDETLAP